MIRSYNVIAESAWHEFGHFCVDLLLIKNPDFQITSVKFTYTIFPDKKTWLCSVKCENNKIKSFSDLITIASDTEVSLSILSLYAGSVFECVYRRRNYNQYETPARIISCGSAVDDGYKVNRIIDELKFDKLKLENWKSVRSDLLTDFFSTLLANEDFILELESIINPIIQRIEDSHTETENLVLELESNEIIELITLVNNSMNNNKIQEELYRYTDNILNAIQ